MSDTSGSGASNPAAGAAPAGFDMLEKMWSMMRMPAFPGMPAGAAAPPLHPSLAMMSDMISPLTNVEELDKRITDMRAVEQWLQLNLNMLQSAIQALEVQRATLATLKAFGAFAQNSMAAAADPASAGPGPGPGPAAAASRPPPAEAASPPPAGTGPSGPGQASTASATAMGMDPAAWWNALQTQFNQIAGLAMATAGAEPSRSTQPRAGAAAPPPPAASAPKRAARKSAPRKAPKAAGKA
jgi:hypothetical protein